MMQDAAVHRIASDSDPYDDVATEAELLIEALDAIRLLLIRPVEPQLINTDPRATKQFRVLNERLESANRKNVMEYVGMTILTSREVTWGDDAQDGNGPSLGAGAGSKTAIIHIAKLSEPLIYREFGAS